MVEEGHGCVGNGFSILCCSRERRGEGGGEGEREGRGEREREREGERERGERGERQ